MKEVRIPIDNKTGKNRNIAFVTFADPNHCLSALRMETMEFMGRKIKISIAEKRKNEKENTNANASKRDDDRRRDDRRRRRSDSRDRHHSKASKNASSNETLDSYL